MMSISPTEDHMGPSGQPSSTTTQDAPACEKIRLTDAGRRGLEAASRSAFEMVTVACNEQRMEACGFACTKKCIQLMKQDMHMTC